ncbi:MAG: PD-(D/E)XK nuclease family protein [Gemmatimonadetes bacterium]|nr:PD-(D/E)XK nuclease family protein [Gemmatimonadota bacterium]
MHLRAYSSWRQAECVGSTKFVTDVEAEFGRHDIPEAKAGRELHQLVEEVIRGTTQLEDIEDGESKRHVSKCLEFIEHWAYGHGKTEVPIELHEDGELVVRCRIDYLDADTMDDSVVVVDWKFYHDALDKIESEWQMKVSLCAAAMHHGKNKGTAKLYLPILDLTYEYEIEDVLKVYTTEILPVWVWLNERRDLQAGPWCARCPVLGRCPTAGQTMQTVAASANLHAIWEAKELPTVKVMEKGLYEGLATLAPAKFRGVLKWLPVVPAFEKAVKRLLREQLAADPSSHPGWELKDKNLPATGDKDALYEATEEYLVAGEFESCKKLSVAQLKETLVDRLVATEKCGTKKAAGFAADTILGPHIVRNTTKELRRKK